MSGSPEVREAVEGDLADILEVQSNSIGAPQWSAAVWTEILRARKSVGAERSILVAIVDGPFAGFVATSQTLDVCEIESLAVAPGLRRRGGATMLLKAAIAQAKLRGAGRLQLEVRASNEAALQLYYGLDFVQDGRRRRYYTDPIEDALLLSKHL